MKKLVLAFILTLLFATTVYAAGFKTVDGKKCLVNDNGEYVTGWITEEYKPAGDDAEAWKRAAYYAEADGTVAVRKWLQLPVSDAGQTRNYWFYFGDGGRKTCNASDSECMNRLIDGKNYAFANDGHMVVGWAKVKDDDDNVSGWRYYREDGTRQPEGWFRAVPDPNLDPEAAKNGTMLWYYAGENGKVVSNALKAIGSKKYLFNDRGGMVTGLVIVSFDGGNSSVSGIEYVKTQDEVESAKGCGDGESKTGLYLFGEDGVMQVGRHEIMIEEQPYQFYFTTSGNKAGKGFTGIQNKHLYTDGILTKADKDAKLEIIDLKNGKQALLNSEGVVYTSGTHKDGDGTKYKVKNGVVEIVD